MYKRIRKSEITDLGNTMPQVLYITLAQVLKLLLLLYNTLARALELSLPLYNIIPYSRNKNTDF